MQYKEWEAMVSTSIREDALWKVTAYRLSLYVADVCWQDLAALMGDKRTRPISDQLYRAVCSIGANVAEGYSRGTGRDRAHFYQYALGSARESRDFYFKSRFVLGSVIFEHRAQTITQIIRLLLTMIPDQRGRAVKENPAAYRESP